MPAVTVPPRIKLQNMLFATDFSPVAQTALSYALNLARAYDARIFSVDVLPHMPFVEAPQPDAEQIRLSAKQQMTALAASELFRGLKHEELIEQGEVPEVLAKLVRDKAIDLIVIGTGGRHGLGKLLLGSVAEEVFRTAECPVLTVGPHDKPWAGPLRHILFVADFGPESVHGLPYAISLAEENRARLTLLHVAPEPGVVLPEPEPGALPVFDREEIIAFTEKHLRDLIPQANQLWHEPEYKVEFGPAADMIVKAAETVDMIVLGVKKPGVLTTHLGEGVAYMVVCEAPCPVLSVGARYHG